MPQEAPIEEELGLLMKEEMEEVNILEEVEEVNLHTGILTDE